MKYYLYISDTKVDMLLQQIPHDVKEKLASEFKIDLKILGATWKRESEIERGRISRLEAVCEFLNTFGNVGHADEPSQYIADTLLMKWNTYTHDLGKVDIVYFGGVTDKSIVGLAGSTHHLIGSTLQPKDVIISSAGMSAGPPIIFWLEGLGRTVCDSLMIYEYMRPDDTYRNLGPESNSWLMNAFLVTQTMQGPKQNLEFLAKRLFQGDYYYDRKQYEAPIKTLEDKKLWHVVIGTPLYVALAD